jgi:cell division protein FtsQ
MPQWSLPAVFDLQRPPSVGKRHSKRAKNTKRSAQATRFEVARARQPKPVRDVPWRRVFGSIAAVAVLGTVATGTAWLVMGDTVRVRQVNVVGSQVVPPYAVAVIAALDGESLLRINLDAAEARVAALPGVAGVDITRDWPQGVQVTLLEQQGWGYWQAGGQRVLVDAAGESLLLARLPASDAPTIIDVAAPADLANGIKVDTDTVALVARLKGEGTFERIGIQPTAFVFRRDRGLTVLVEDSPDTVFGDSTNYAFKVATWEALIEELAGEELLVAEIDLRFGRNVVMR